MRVVHLYSVVIIPQ